MRFPHSRRAGIILNKSDEFYLGISAENAARRHRKSCCLDARAEECIESSIVDFRSHDIRYSKPEDHIGIDNLQVQSNKVEY